MVRSRALTYALTILLLYTTTTLAASDDWQYHVSSAPVELVPGSLVNFTLSAPDSQVLVTIDSNVTNAVLVSWNATYSWYFPPPSTTVQRSVSIPFGQKPHITISILNPQDNQTLFSDTPQFSLLASTYTINVTPVVRIRKNSFYHLLEALSYDACLKDGKDQIVVNSSDVIITCSWADENNTSISSTVWAYYDSNENDFSCQFAFEDQITYTA